MKADQLTEVFVKQLGARKDGPALVVPDSVEAVLFVALEGETLTIARVARLEVAETLCTVDTLKGERYVLAAEDVRAVRLDRREGTRRGGSAGFK
jgi:hypothetical protein